MDIKELIKSENQVTISINSDIELKKIVDEFKEYLESNKLDYIIIYKKCFNKNIDINPKLQKHLKEEGWDYDVVIIEITSENESISKAIIDKIKSYLISTIKVIVLQRT